jgi:hypothetical protein
MERARLPKIGWCGSGQGFSFFAGVILRQPISGVNDNDRERIL